ncbi:SpoIIAA family protein [Phaeobacter marinintestinus]|uniref:STAS/SEC14 domain-containing protein n=1 Tax=Falsiphaeobacter marinintestinus TaxID=1492905 RepID=UPI001FE663DB|nr:STAS/SEC14 domain-containing protein [Phaeobacter marinintestinus]
MIEVIDTNTSGQLEVRMSGTVTAADYDNVLTPALAAALADSDTVRLLVLVDEDLTFDAGAAWADMKLGLNYWQGFDRAAVCVSGGWMASAVRAFAPLMPCPIQVFDSGQADEARRWLRESLGAAHLRDLGGPVLQIDLVGKVGPEDYARLQGDLDAKLAERDGFRLLIDAREFDGWHGLSAFRAHFSLAHDHAPLLDKAAIVGDRAWQKIAQKVGSRFVNAETRFFDAAEFEQAKSWLMSDQT